MKSSLTVKLIVNNLCGLATLRSGFTWGITIRCKAVIDRRDGFSASTLKKRKGDQRNENEVQKILPESSCDSILGREILECQPPLFLLEKPGGGGVSCVGNARDANVASSG